MGHLWGIRMGHPCGWECGVGGGHAGGWAPHLGSFFLKFLNGPFVNAPAFVDEVPGGGGFPRVHMPNDDDVDVRLLLPHVGGLRGAGGGGEGCGNAAVFLGRLRGKEAGVSKDPPVTAPSQPRRGWLSSPRPTFPLDHAPHPPRGCPASSSTSARPGMEPAGLFLATTYSLQVSARCRVIRRLALHCRPGDPQFPGLRHRCLEGALPPRKKPSHRLRVATAAFSVFPNPRASPPCRGCPGRSHGCPSLRAALAAPKLRMVRVTTWCPQNGTDKNSPHPLPPEQGCK